jgi:hypothetical protein
MFTAGAINAKLKVSLGFTVEDCGAAVAVFRASTRPALQIWPQADFPAELG